MSCEKRGDREQSAKGEASDGESAGVDNGDAAMSTTMDESKGGSISNMTENAELGSEHDLWI